MALENARDRAVGCKYVQASKPGLLSRIATSQKFGALVWVVEAVDLGWGCLFREGGGGGGKVFQSFV